MSRSCSTICNAEDTIISMLTDHHPLFFFLFLFFLRRAFSEWEMPILSSDHLHVDFLQVELDLIGKYYDLDVITLGGTH